MAERALKGGLPLVTVVITTYNRQAFVREAIASVQAQTLTDWELIVVDDHSLDGTWAWLEALTDERICALRQPENMERARARNRGLEEARGEFIVFLDDDDCLYPTGLEAMAAALRANPAAVLCAGRRVKRMPDGSCYPVPHAARPFCQRIWKEVLAGWGCISGQAMMRTAAVCAAGGYDPRMLPCEDRDLLARLSWLGPAAIIPDEVVEIRIHSGQIRAWPDIFLKRNRVQEKFLRENLPPIRRALALPLVWSERFYRRADRLYDRGGFLPALALFLAACLAAPRMLTSPLSRRLYWQRILRSGRNALAGTRRG